MKQSNAWTIALLVGLAPGAADAQTAAVKFQLQYTAPKGCPSEQSFRDSLWAKMGHHPVSPEAKAELVAALRREGKAFEANVRYVDEAGQSIERPRVSGGDCADLVEEIAVDVNSHYGVAPPPPAPAPPPPLAEAPAPSSAPPALPAERPPAPETPEPRLARPIGASSPRRPLLSMGGWVGALNGVAPRPAAAFTLDLGLRWPLASVSVEGRATLPSGALVGAGAGTHHLEIALTTAALVPCLHYRTLVGCARVEAGDFRATGTVTEHTLYAGVGGRVGAEVPIAPQLSARLAVDLMAPFRMVTFCPDPRLACNPGDPTFLWGTSSVNGGLGGGLVGFF
ncbi:MAG: hypothetical protein U0359_26765 [Byssovorax sp.]